MSLNSVPSNQQFFFEALDACCKKIVDQMGDKPITEWRITEYNTLSSQLGKQTKVYLSENTLKRIFGRLKTPQRYFPQKATRDALAQFIGYRDWQEFELVYTATKKTQLQWPKAEAEQVSPTPVLNKPKTSRLAVVAIVTLLAIGIFAYLILKKSAASVDVELVCYNPFGNVPHSAVFGLKSKNTFDQIEEFKLDFLEEALPATIAGNKKVTRFFRNPGVVYATLFERGVPIDTVSVCLQTKGWVANSGNDTSRAYPIAKLEPLDPKNIFVSNQQLDSAGLDTKRPFLEGFSNVHKSNIDGDNFSFSTKIFAEQSRPGVQCIETTIIVLGERDRHILTLFRENCVALSRYSFSEKKAIGTDEFMGKLAFNPENGGDVALKVENKNVHIILNGREVMAVRYQRGIGKVLGVKILFNGIGKAVSPQLQDLKTKEFF